ncbi:GNAT family N-acetyltransferase [Pseudomonas proteolytica]|uniref:GNAT family N-acetyltransferase n=1 Tax=Pseudomonas proteolytica TaxID=219574 RepID=UPI001475784C|nr:GNAT family N-acetyltransferase [Pseudomonas proteolytica]NMZ42857.1 GNAT family N-acetyltransferase [Pseudomonas proteolytica]
MPLFDSIRRFFRGRHGTSVNSRAPHIHLVNQLTESYPGRFVYPGTDFVDDIELDGQRVGYVDYGINPLGDRLYINMLDIEPEHQRQGIGLSVLWTLWSTHQIPIVPLHQYASSDTFWDLARERFAAAGALIEDEIRVNQLDAAKERWQHLVPEPEHERLIREYWEWVESEKAAGRPAGPGIR